jgi:phosphoribosylcarboxyaminoimidazole (NCAIR) mutase
MSNAVVGVVMGSDSDWSVMSDAAQVLKEFGIEYEVEVLSAHRTPERMIEWGKAAAGRGLKVIIAGAGGAAHLPGMLASVTGRTSQAGRHGFTAFDRADAGRHPGRHRLDQRC